MAMQKALSVLVIMLAAQPAAAASLKTIYDFGDSRKTGFAPAGQLAAGADGTIYGVTTNRFSGGGAVYRLTRPSTGGPWTALPVWHFVSGKVGLVPSPGLAPGKAPDQFVGATDANTDHQNYGCGSVFLLTVMGKGGNAAAISHLNGRAGCYPQGPVNVERNGDALAITENGGSEAGFGAIVQFKHPTNENPHWVQELLYAFTGGNDGFYPEQPMLLSRTGALYGAALASSNGRAYPTPLFRLAPPLPGQTKWVFSLAYQFKPSECSDGVGELIEDKSLAIYGACSDNVIRGADRHGNVFKLTPPADPKDPWIRTLLYSFTGGADGGRPANALTLDSAGNLYGTTPQGHGTVFRLSPPADGQTEWTETTLYRFSGTDGDTPSSPLLLTTSGTLIGTTFRGGPNRAGTVFELTP